MRHVLAPKTFHFFNFIIFSSVLAITNLSFVVQTVYLLKLFFADLISLHLSKYIIAFITKVLNYVDFVLSAWIIQLIDFD